MAIKPRPDWREKVEAIGFDFHTMEGTYWDESACYRFTAGQIDLLEDATNALHALCLKAVDHAIKRNLFGELKIPDILVPLIRRSWEAREPALYGRFDLCYDGARPPKLLEYNADTPTALFEASVIQWAWLEELYPGNDQFNSIHEKLIERWKILRDALPVMATIYFTCARDSAEDFTTVGYLRDVAMQSGADTDFIFIDDIGWNAHKKEFVDLDSRAIRTIFKLYPWEWLAREQFGRHLNAPAFRVIEPAWKLILSSKAILPLLWELFPGHPNLLPAYRDASRFVNKPYVEKPIYSREGANITIHNVPGGGSASNGPYDREHRIYQEYCPLPCFDGHYPVIGSWIIGDVSSGIGIREDASIITKNTSRFVPHYFI